MDILPILNEVFAINLNGEDNEAFFNHGINWLWAVTAIHIVTFLAILSLCFVVPESKRVFHYLFTVAVLVGAVSYYGQAATTTLFFARYANWLIAFPSLALGLSLASGVSWTTIACNMAITWLWILPYFIASLTLTSYKWGFFAFGTVSYFILAMSTLNESYKEAKRRGIGRDYLILAGWVNFLWFLYPIAFGISDGGHKVSRTVGSIIFGVLDVFLLPIFAFVFTWFANKWDWHKLELDFSAYRGRRQPEMETTLV
ncbi:hypothetical protein NCS52_01329000 [Fusarium sp. LHS14.1]|nr:hypothetical protein NCS52_01329000 [Fusarium sp. LHS14.1]